MLDIQHIVVVKLKLLDEFAFVRSCNLTDEMDEAFCVGFKFGAIVMQEIESFKREIE